MSKHTQYVTAMVRPQTKEVLEARAKLQGLSLSKFVSQVLDAYVVQPYEPPPTKEQKEAQKEAALARIAAEFD